MESIRTAVFLDDVFKQSSQPEYTVYTLQPKAWGDILFRRLLFGSIFLLTLSLRAELPSESEFEALAIELAPKVDLFQEVWRQDPNAEFYGGTSRNFLYWIRGAYRNCRNQSDVNRKTAELKAMSSIAVREFITRESDIDVISSKKLSIVADDYAVKRVDTVSPDILNPKTELGKTEIQQGHIPTEKIRLGRNGIRLNPLLGNGLKEIHSGNLTVKFADPAQFSQTTYAKKGWNHPVLLALRFLRLQAMDYYSMHGQSAPDKKRLFDIDAESAKAVKQVIKSATRDPELARLLQNPKFAAKANETIQKAFRSYTNPTAARELYNQFGGVELIANFKSLEPINQYVFARTPIENSTLTSRFQEYGVTQASICVPREQVFPDGKLYHGSKTEAGFESILMAGVLPSERGTAGGGLYGVSKKNINFAESWAGTAKRVVSFDVRPEAKIADLTDPETSELFFRFRQRTGGDENAFADYFGIDILRYPYGSEAYVVKNSGVLDRAQGVHRKVFRGFSDLHEAMAKIRDPQSFIEFLAVLSMLRTTTKEESEILNKVATALPEKVIGERALRILNSLKGHRGLKAKILHGALSYHDAIEREAARSAHADPKKIAGRPAVAAAIQGIAEMAHHMANRRLSRAPLGEALAAGLDGPQGGIAAETLVAGLAGSLGIPFNPAFERTRKTWSRFTLLPASGAGVLAGAYLWSQTGDPHWMLYSQLLVTPLVHRLFNKDGLRIMDRNLGMHLYARDSFDDIYFPVAKRGRKLGADLPLDSVLSRAFRPVGKGMDLFWDFCGGSLSKLSRLTGQR